DPHAASHRSICLFFFFSSRRRHTRFSRDWSSDVCSSDLSPFRSPVKGCVGGGAGVALPVGPFVVRGGGAVSGSSESEQAASPAPRTRAPSTAAARLRTVMSEADRTCEPSLDRSARG